MCEYTKKLFTGISFFILISIVASAIAGYTTGSSTFGISICVKAFMLLAMIFIVASMYDVDKTYIKIASDRDNVYFDIRSFNAATGLVITLILTQLVALAVEIGEALISGGLQPTEMFILAFDGFILVVVSYGLWTALILRRILHSYNTNHRLTSTTISGDSLAIGKGMDTDPLKFVIRDAISQHRMI
jgi:hypothetical protein